MPKTFNKQNDEVTVARFEILISRITGKEPNPETLRVVQDFVKKSKQRRLTYSEESQLALTQIN